MVAKLIQYFLTLSVAIGLVSCGAVPASNQTQPALMQAGQQITAAGTVTGTLFDQPVDPSGKLYLSA